MTGGLMNIVAYGNENILFNGNPKKTYFKSTYQKYTNFGLQRFRIDFEGAKNLSEKTNSTFTFKIPRYAEMLYDTYLVINLPNIYSPIYHYNTEEGVEEKNGHTFTPYEFKWIEELGTNWIEEIEIHSGGTSLGKYSGEYLNCLKERDFSEEKKKLWNRMTGNVNELHDPANANGNVNIYPNVFYNTGELSMEPSIRGRKLYIPLDAFFCDSSKLALPLVALQYQEISIKIELKPVMDVYTINNINETPSTDGLTYRIRPNKNILEHQMWRFLQAPKDNFANTSLYNKNIIDWNSDIHLIGTYVFLGQDERRILAVKEHNILIKQIYTYNHFDVAGSKIVEIESKDMVCNYMWRFRRSDAYLRNEWSNYTNWPYRNVIPKSVELITGFKNPAQHYFTGNIGLPGEQNPYPINLKQILLNLGVTMDGVYREKVLDAGVYNYLEKYIRTSGGAKDGLYCYSFSVNSNRRDYQPSGAMNVNKFKTIAFEFTTIETPIDISGSNIEYICDLNGNAIGFRKTSGALNIYNFDLIIFEERYNVMKIQGGRIGLLNAR